MDGLNPSRAYQWSKCPGSYRLSEGITDTIKSDIALKGLAAHKIAASSAPHSFINTLVEGVLVDSELANDAQNYLDYLNSHIGFIWQYERQIVASSIHPQCRGTIDAISINENEIHIVEFKYGYRQVRAKENLQMICYYAGILDELRIPDKYLTVHFHVIQPHAENNVWTTQGDSLRGYVNHLYSMAGQVFSRDPFLKAGSHCLYCKGAFKCPALKNAASDIFDTTSSSGITELLAEELGWELTRIVQAQELLKIRGTAIEARLQWLIESGVSVPDYVLEPSEGRLAWKIDTAQIFALGDILGIDLRSDPTPITPTQAKKKGLAKDIVAECSYRPILGKKLKHVKEIDTKWLEI